MEQSNLPSCKYLDRRQKNIDERRNKFASIFNDFEEINKKFKSFESQTTNHRVKSIKSRRSDSIDSYVPPFKLKRPEAFNRSPPRTRSKKKTIYDWTFSEDDVPPLRETSDGSTNIKTLVIKFPFVKINRLKKLEDANGDEIFEVHEERECESPKRHRRVGAVRHATCPRTILMPDEITDKDLNSVEFCASKKKYHAFKGTSCHQCRQKTLDMKTVCRSTKCFGVRGQFCGTCLRNRYGEDARVALKDPAWECPVCRNICNCSFCRAKQGKRCTGILIHEAKEEGFDNVRDYLENCKN